MNHNPHNLKAGDTVVLDKDIGEYCEVIIKYLTRSELFTSVYRKDAYAEIRELNKQIR